MDGSEDTAVMIICEFLIDMTQECHTFRFGLYLFECVNFSDIFIGISRFIETCATAEMSKKP